MDCFVKNIFLKKEDDATHRQFVRFGKGTYPGRAALSLKKNGMIKVGGSFEYANDFARIAAEVADAQFSGIVFSKEGLEEFGLKGKKKGEIFEYEFEGNSQDVKNIAGKAYYMLLDADAGVQGIKLRIKKKLPKPGKAGNIKIDDKFCVLEADLKFWSRIKEAFFWDLPECKMAKISHSYIIEGIVLPPGENNPEKMRLLAKRKGKIIRRIVADKNEMQREEEMEV